MSGEGFFPLIQTVTSGESWHHSHTVPRVKNFLCLTFIQHHYKHDGEVRDEEEEYAFHGGIPCSLLV